MAQGRATGRRAFRPTLDGRLEPRWLLSHGHLHAAALHGLQPVPMQIKTANGGRAVIIRDTDGELFEVTLTSDLQSTTVPPISAGILRAKIVPGGRVAIVAEGTTQDSILQINPVLKSPVKGQAHGFAGGMAGQDHLLNVAGVAVTSGQIRSILGFHSAVLSGPIVSAGNTPVSRIAFADLLPGASIAVGGDLQTLEILNNITLDGGPSITIGRDLDWINAGGNLSLTGGSSFIVGRDLGLQPQPAKGTGIAGQGGLILGNMVIGPGSKFVIVRNLDAPFVVQGSGTGTSRLAVGGTSAGFFFVGGSTP